MGEGLDLDRYRDRNLERDLPRYHETCVDMDLEEHLIRYVARDLDGDRCGEREREAQTYTQRET